MLHYYFTLGVRSLRRNPALTLLMVLTLAVGVAASVSTLTILHVMAGDPLPGKSGRLFTTLIDNGPRDGYTPGSRPPEGLSYRDSANLLASGQGLRRTAVYGVNTTVQPARRDMAALRLDGIATGSDFFTMFDTPFRAGQAWSADDDARGADVVVLAHSLADKLFGAADAVGQRVTLSGQSYLVVGVLATWDLPQRFYYLFEGTKPKPDEQFMIPFSNAVRHQRQPGSLGCTSSYSGGFEALLASECYFVQFWFETGTAAERAALQQYLDHYADDQRRLGRLPRKAPNRLMNVTEWLDYSNVVGDDNRVTAWLAFGFLLLCLVNTVGLLLAKFSGRAGEVGVRRALGASQRAIFQQFLVETAVLGLAGGLLGLLFAVAALVLIGQQSAELGAVAHMDWPMLTLTVVMAVGTALLAGLLPAWRACRTAPARHLKSQ
jgi:putative ABC transport system permease protein